jgi:hypothetical protein
VSRTFLVIALSLGFLAESGTLRGQESVPPPAPKVDREALAADEQVLARVELQADGPSLLAFFRKHTPRPEDITRSRTLIGQLAAEDFFVRQKAYEELLAIGSPARSFLQQASRNPDVEVRWRVEKCLELIDTRAGPDVVAAAGRVLAQRLRTDGGQPWAEEASAVLLAFAPHTEDRERTLDALSQALAQCAVQDGQPGEELRQALRDKQPSRRLIAALAVLHGSKPRHHALVHPLLVDANLEVRRWCAEALIRTGDKTAVVPFIQLLTVLPANQRWQVEDVLYDLAEDPPRVSSKRPAEQRAAWLGWWKEHQEEIDLVAALRPRPFLGYTVIAMKNLTGVNGRVVELDRKGKVRWQITGLRYPTDAKVVGKDRVVIAEYTNRTVSERTFKGKVNWQKRFRTYPLGVQPLKNGNIFVFTRNSLVELNARGKEVSRINRTDSIYSAYKRRNGEIILITSARRCIRLDPKGKVIKSFGIGYAYSRTKIQVVKGNRVLVPEYSRRRVVEYDLDGEVIRIIPADYPVAVQKLPGGNLLLSSYTRRRVWEADRSGKVVWIHNANGRPYSAHRR